MLGDGPGGQAATRGRPVLIPDLARIRSRHWPMLRRSAQRRGRTCQRSSSPLAGGQQASDARSGRAGQADAACAAACGAAEKGGAPDRERGQ
ncbi:hypothetical protein [Kitasatospora sp. NPDC059571]|uniref:hypothetical protein n=1 Tax=Kitasatospora sp. NPDC059571 TaxID=3346871 RepID=UPI0036829821